MSRNGWITVGLGIMPADRYVMTYDLASSSSMYGTYTYSTPGNDSQIPKQCLKKQVRKKNPCATHFMVWCLFELAGDFAQPAYKARRGKGNENRCQASG